MSDFLIRKIPKKTLSLARKMALKHRRSLQEEISSIVIEGIHFRSGAWSRDADIIRRKTGGRIHSDSAEILREDRSR